eukprot:Nitzschia sp. Nitz4//scaffold140_size61219//18532//19308//NITZ4_006436-RA/size61219-processed-gene-0.17-mRNA-1//-1//CDS//3329536215//956//frame0
MIAITTSPSGATTSRTTTPSPTPSNSSSSAAPSTTVVGKRKKHIPNKFLTKTFHMLGQCSDDIAGWSHGGESFTIYDTELFASEVLPKYFNHSRFSSFIRQLNFYGFSKQRSDPDLQTHTTAVRFSHPSFRRGHPDLLSKIQRTTAGKPQLEQQDLNTEEVTSLQDQVSYLQNKLSKLEESVDQRVDEATRSIEKVWSSRIQSLEHSYETILSTLVSQYASRNMVAATPVVAKSSVVHPPLTGLAELAEYIRSSQKTT